MLYTCHIFKKGKIWKYYLAPIFILIFLSIFCTKFPNEPRKHDNSQNQIPIANIQILSTKTIFAPGDSVMLDATNSYDPDSSSAKQELTFKWRTLNGGRLTDDALAQTYFISDSSGIFTIALTVYDGERYSEPAIEKVTIADTNLAPVSVIKILPSDSASINTPVNLDGTLSHDPNGDSLTYSWESLDGGIIEDTTSAVTNFMALEQGNYVISLIVSDGINASTRAFANVTVSTQINQHPLINLEADTLIDVDAWANLDARKSHDPDGDDRKLQFRWERLNGGHLESSTSAVTRFRSDIPNLYVLSLQVTDELGEMSEHIFTIRVKGKYTPEENHSPIAHAGRDQITFINETVSLNGNHSIDPDNDLLSYYWQTMNGGEITNASQMVAQFTPTEKGIFEISLTVSDSSLSDVDTVHVTVPNRAPICDAGPDETLNLNSSAILNGSQSYDPDDDDITYYWNSFGEGNIENPHQRNTIFLASETGTYTISLTVSDGEDSTRDIVNIQFVNQKPIANAGINTITDVKSPATLDGRNSHDPDEDNLTYRWTALNGGFIEDSLAAVTEFTSENPGNFIISLVVNDGYVDSEPAFVEITVLCQEFEIPHADAGQDTTYLFGQQVRLDGSESWDPNGLPLNFTWIEIETNPGHVTLSNTETPEFIPPYPGEYVFMLYVDNGTQVSIPDQVKITIAEPDLYISKTRPIEPNKVYRTITEGLEVAQSGFLIFVEPGLYDENVSNFESGITLLSTDRANTVIDGRGLGSTFFLDNVTNVTISGFTTIRGGRVDPDQIDVACITCTNAATNITIQNSIIKDAYGDGVRLYHARNVKLINSILENNDINGIRSSTSSLDVINCLIRNNGENALDNTAGISVETHGGDASVLSIKILENTFHNNQDKNIQLTNDSPVEITDNIFTGNYEGIYTTPNSGVDLTVTQNRFLISLAAPIFCLDKAHLTISENIFDNTNNPQLNIGIDLGNCDGKINKNKFNNYITGINLFYSPLEIYENTFQNNQIGIKVGAGMTPPNNYEQDNTFEGNGINVDYP